MLETLPVTLLRIIELMTGGAISKRLVSKGTKYLYGGTYGRMFSPEDALRYFSFASHVAPQNPDAYMEFAIHGYGHLLVPEDEALRALDRACDADSQYSRAYLHRAVFRSAESLVAMKMEDPTLEATILANQQMAAKSSDGLNDYASAIHHNPKFLYPYYDRACLLYMWGMVDRAIEDCERILQCSRDSHLTDVTRRKLEEIRTDPKRSTRFGSKRATTSDVAALIRIENQRRELILSRNQFYWHFLSRNDSVERLF